MLETQTTYDRVAFSLPHSMNTTLDSLKKELKKSKSDIIKQAIEDFMKKQKDEQLMRAVELMDREYKSNGELTSFTALDSKHFQ